MVFLIAVAGASAAGLANPALAYQLAFGFSAVMAVATLGFIVARYASCETCAIAASGAVRGPSSPENTSQVRKPCFTGDDALSRFA